MSDPQEQIIRKLRENRRLAHRMLFGEKHTHADAPFHGEMIDSFHAIHPYDVTEGFRGCAKSTTAEEGFVITALLKECKNGLVVAENEPLALEKLHAIKNQIENNEMIREIFGDQVGSVWTERRALLANGVMLQARGMGQAMRGTKYLDCRPDMVLMDDIETDETVSTLDQRNKVKRWVFKTMIPACDPNARIRWIGNRLHPEAILVETSKDPEWVHHRYPIEYIDTNGNRQASWVARFPLEWIDKKRASFARKAMLNEFNQEYMCEARAEEEKAFSSEMVRVIPRSRVWEAVYGMFDPARTVKRTSAETGFACWSYVGNKLVVWDAWGKLLKPDEIINEMFTFDNIYAPVLIGFEGDGLNEWAAQPIRQAQITRRHALPLREAYAPKDRSKGDFIKSLQPFFKAGEVEFAKELPELREQILSFPTGKVDVLNALAYALRLKPGAPIYDEFTQDNIAENLLVSPRRPLYLILNATKTFVTGQLVQHGDGIRVLADWVEDSEPSVGVSQIIRNASLETDGTRLKLIAPPFHWDQWSNVGLRQAVARIPAEVRKAGGQIEGKEELRRLFREFHKGLPGIIVSHEARWTLNGFSGGYCREYGKRGVLMDEAREGPYRTIMEGLESFAAMLKFPAMDDDGSLNYSRTVDGRQYVSAMVRR